MDRTTLLALPIATALALAAGKVHASTDYPAAIRSKAGLTYTPACTLCHAEEDGSDGVIATDFAKTLWALGMRGGDAGSLERALDKDRSRRWDTDGDGVSDIDELLGSTDPSGPALSNFPGPEHGCAVGSVHREGGAWRTMAVLGAAVAMRLRRRRGRQSWLSQFRRPG